MSGTPLQARSTISSEGKDDMPDASVNWLLVGTGDIVRKRVAAALQDAANSRIAAICARSFDRARALADELGVADVFTDYDEALGKASADAVYLATPVGAHIGQAVAAMRAGKHVLVEKPMGLDGNQCTQAVEVAEETGVTAGCAYYRRFYPRYEDARQMLANGEFGKVLFVRMVNRSWYAPAAEDPKRWRLTRNMSGGGPLADVGSHMLDMMVGLFGLPDAVFAKVDSLVHKRDVEDAAAALMTLAGGAYVSADFRWNAKPAAHEFEIIGTEAALKWIPCDTGKVVKTVGGDVHEIDMPNADNVHLPLVADFVDAVLETCRPRIGLLEAAKTNIVMDAIYESDRTGREIRL